MGDELTTVIVWSLLTSCGLTLARYRMRRNYQNTWIMGNTPSDNSKTKIESTAYHEAGHAVAAIVQDLVIVSVTIEPDEDSLGSCIGPGVFGYEYAGDRERKRIARDCILVSYAGLQAEKHFNPEAEEWRSDNDEENAFNMSREFSVLPRGCNYVGDELHCKYLTRLQRKAHRLIIRHWQSVDAVAKAILKDKTLFHDQIKKIIRQINCT